MTLLQAGAFKAGDFIDVKSASRKSGRACIILFRYAIGNYNTGRELLGADLLFDDGTMGFHFLHDIARWNPDKIKETFAADH